VVILSVKQAIGCSIENKFVCKLLAICFWLYLKHSPRPLDTQNYQCLKPGLTLDKLFGAIAGVFDNPKFIENTASSFSFLLQHFFTSSVRFLNLLLLGCL